MNLESHKILAFNPLTAGANYTRFFTFFSSIYHINYQTF